LPDFNKSFGLVATQLDIEGGIWDYETRFLATVWKVCCRWRVECCAWLFRLLDYLNIPAAVKLQDIMICEPLIVTTKAGNPFALGPFPISLKVTPKSPIWNANAAYKHESCTKLDAF